jgi:hypothetical protein
MSLTKTDINKKAMLEALEKSLGIVTTACKTVGISRETHYQYYKTDKHYRKACKDIENVTLDFAESQLHKQIAKGNPLSIMFFLKCKARKRGYIEQQDIKIQGNMKFKVDFGTSDPIHASQEPTDNP